MRVEIFKSGNSPSRLVLEEMSLKVQVFSPSEIDNKEERETKEGGKGGKMKRIEKMINKGNKGKKEGKERSYKYTRS